MSSIIVLDSSDEDESPPKKANVKLSSDPNTAVTNTSKTQNAKQRAIPSGITITPRLSPTSQGAKSSVNMQPLNASTLAASFLALNNMINNDRQTPTPPRGPQASNTNQRKRKTPTPPQPMSRLSAKNYATMTNSSPAKAATTVAPLPPIMPMITGVHSMAAGTTPPLQLMATPPHNLGAFMGLNEQLMINPHLIPAGLPPNTTITTHTNPNHNNINNNFKIHLPFNKPNTTTPSPAASPASSAPKTPSPQLTPSPQPGRSDKPGRRIKPTTILKSTDENWQRHKQNDKMGHRATPISLNNDVVIEMLPPTTESPKSLSASSSRHQTPMTSPTTPKSQKSPDVIMLTTPTTSSSVTKDNDTVLDLTNSPDKSKQNPTEIVDLVNTPEQKKPTINGDSSSNNKSEKKPEKPPPKPPLEPEYQELLKVCREADPSNDMSKLIKTKLIKYYYEVHSDFVKSKSFRKSINKVIEAIKAKPDLVYIHVKTIVEELKVRRKARLVEEASIVDAGNAVAATAANIKTEPTATDLSSKPDKENTTTTLESDKSPAVATTASSSTAGEISATASTSTGNKKLDEQIKKLNKALYVVTKRIEVLEQAEVNWDDDDDSSFLQVERYKKRACQIYEKICDLTGESKNAHRLVKKPIKFNETRIPQFNKTLQAFINRTKEFPDYFDVLRMLEHCNRKFNLGLINFEMKNIAQDAFIKVGKLLQSRRKADLYETVTHYAGDGKDPAKSDPVLAAKLNENLKNHKKISEILEKFARKQDMPDEEEEEKSDKTESVKDDKETKEGECDESDKMEIDKEELNKTKNNTQQGEEGEIMVKSEKLEDDKVKTPDKQKMKVDGKEGVVIDDDEDEDEEDDDDDEEDEDEDINLDEQVETLANGDISDNESDNEIEDTKHEELTKKNLNKTADSIVTLDESTEIMDKTLDNSIISIEHNSTAESLEISHNIQEIFKNPDTIQNCNEKDSFDLKINSESDSLLIKNNNNNNNNLDLITNKTVLNTNSTTPVSSSYNNDDTPLMPVSISTTPNGKLKDSMVSSNTSHLLSNNNNSDKSNEVITTPIATVTTTTTTADLKIVHVSSLEPDTETIVTTSAGNKSELSTKSLDEIVISDEES